MLISEAGLRFLGVRPKGVLHVGAHEGEESALYERCGWGPVTWVDMLPDKVSLLREKFKGDPNNKVIEAACWDSETEITVQRGTNTGSSSLLTPKDHLTSHPEVTFSADITVRTKRLDDVLPSTAQFDFLNLDTQGAELRILRGMGDRVKALKWAYVEVNEVEIYEGCALLPEIDRYFAERGFARAIRLMAGSAGWGDALYVRVSHMSAGKRKLLRLQSRLLYLWYRIRWAGSTPAWDNWR